MKISIIVPVLNGESQIKDCIESLIDQDYPKDQYEIIVVDNGSKDNTLAIATDILHSNRDVRFVLTKEFVAGSYAARNKGIDNSNGKIIVFTDSDCIADINWLKELSIGFEDKDIGCVVGAIQPYPGKTLVEIFSKNANILSQNTTLKSEFLPYGQTANVAFRKDVFGKIGIFDNTVNSGGDADLAWRMQLFTKYKLIYHPDAFVQHKHRTTIRKLFKQYFNYGTGNVLLYKKYEDLMKYNTGDSLSDWIKTIIVGILLSTEKIINNPNRYNILEPFLLMIQTVALRTGRLYGSYKLRMLYV